MSIVLDFAYETEYLHVQQCTNPFHSHGQIREQTTRICERGHGMECIKGKSDLTNSNWEGA